jgi:hypothetical protein
MKVLMILHQFFLKSINFESIFTRDDQVRMPNLKEEASSKNVLETQKINIEIEESPKYVNLGSGCT